MYGTKPRYNEPISLVPWHFVKSRFHRISITRNIRAIPPPPPSNASACYCRVLSWIFCRFQALSLTTALSNPCANYIPRFCCLVDRRCQTFFWTSWWFYHCLPSVKSAHNPVGYLSLASRDHRHVDPIRKRVQRCKRYIYGMDWSCDAIC